jgi:hypothetical protein
MKMLPGKEPARGGSFAVFRMPGERVLIAIIAILFLTLHLLTSAMLRRAAAGEPASPREQARMSLYD